MEDLQARRANDPVAGGHQRFGRLGAAAPFLVAAALLFDMPSALRAQPGVDGASGVASDAPTGRPAAEIAALDQDDRRARVYLPYALRQGWALRTTVGGGSFAVASLGPNVVLVGVGRRVMSLDVSDPLAIRELDRSPMLPGLAWRMVVDGGVAYVVLGDGRGLSALDVSDPGDLRLLASFPAATGPTSDVEANGNVVFVAGESLTTYIRSGPTWRVASRLRLPQHANAMVEVDGFVFVTQTRAGLAVVDARDPEHPSLVGIAEAACEECSASSGDLAVVGDFALIPDGYRTRILDVGDRARPRHVGFIEGREPRRIAIEGNRAYVFEGSAGTQVLDISDPRRPSELGSIRGDAYDGYVAAGQLFTVGLNATLRIHDLAAADAAPPMAEFRTLMSADRAAGGANVAFVADGDRIWTVGADAQGALHEIGSVNIGARSRDLTAVGRLAFAATATQRGPDHDDIVHIIRAAADGRPEIAAAVPVPGINCLAAVGRVVYAGGVNGLTVLDVSDPARPTTMAVVSMAMMPPLDEVELIAVGHDLLAVAGRTYGANGSPSEPLGFWLYTLDVTDPNQPRIGSILQLPAQPIDLAIVDHAVYVAEWEFGLRVVDASEPLRPRLHGSVPTRSQPRGLAVGAGRLYVAETFFLSETEHALIGGPGIRMFDIERPLDPVPLMTIDAFPGASRLAVGSGGELLIGGDASGLIVIDAR